MIYSVKMTDTHNGLKAIKRSCLEKIELNISGYGFETEIIMNISKKKILFKNFSDSTFLIVIPSFQNILSEVFLTGFFAPLICSQIFRLFKFSREKSLIKNFSKK